MGYPPDDITAVGWKRSENLTPKLYLHGPLSGWNNVWSGFWALQYPILLLMSSKVGEKTFCKVSADSSKLEGTATAFEDSIVTHNDPDKMQKQSEKIRCNLRWICAKLSLMHNQLLKYRMGTTDYKAVLQESVWHYSESEAVHESIVLCSCKKGICQTGTYKQVSYVVHVT